MRKHWFKIEGLTKDMYDEFIAYVRPILDENKLEWEGCDDKSP